MWFRRRSANRRFARKHILDVKLRSSQRRHLRVRRITVTIACVLLAAIGGFGIWRGGELALRRLLYENPAFATHHLEVETDGVIAREQLRRWAGVKLEDNLLALDLERVKRDLELVPVIQSAAVERVLPNTLRIRVIEREPVARFYYPILRASGIVERGTCLVDAHGMVMYPLEPHQRSVPTATTNDALPVLVGMPAQETRPGRRIESLQVRAAIQLITEFERSSMAEITDIKEIDVSMPGTLQVLSSHGTELLVGLGESSQALRRWRAVYDHVHRFGKRVAWIDLSVSNNVPARFADATLSPPVPPKVNKPSRKRHV
jgi:cell division septal protein FtsQ